jgi:hypothetical protein
LAELAGEEGGEAIDQAVFLTEHDGGLPDGFAECTASFFSVFDAEGDTSADTCGGHLSGAPPRAWVSEGGGEQEANDREQSGKAV